MSQFCNYPEPGSLKACLQLMAKLSESSVSAARTAILKQLKDNVGNFCDSNYLKSFTESAGSLYNAFNKAETMNFMILSSAEYGSYGSLTSACIAHTGCIDKLAQFLKKYLPKVYAMLYFLYFNTDDKLLSMHGGQWNSYKLDQSSTELVKWLDDAEADVFMPRDFNSHELKASTSGSHLSSTLRQLISHDISGHLQKALSPMLFVCNWDYGLTGHACLFLHTFYQKVGTMLDRDGYCQKQFYTVYTNGDFNIFKKLCSELSGSIAKFIADSSNSGIAPVCWNNTSLYNEALGVGDLEADKFRALLGWLQTHLAHIVAALQDMSYHCKDWTQESLKLTQSAGPFKYGFVFKDGWQAKLSGLPSAIDKLLHAILQLLMPASMKECLQLFAKLSTLSILKTMVLTTIKDRFKDYCYHDSDYVKSFDNTEAYLAKTFFLFTQMLQPIFRTDKYGNYSGLKDNKSDVLARWYADVIIKYIPQVYSDMYFVYFNVFSDCSQIGGYQWKDQMLNPSTKKEMYQWFTNASISGSEFMSRGFLKEELNRSSASGIANALQGSDGRSAFGHSVAGQLQHAIAPMLFIFDWHESLTGHACFFLKIFCEQVSTASETAFMPQLRKLKLTGSFGTLQDVCKRLKISLEVFVGSTAKYLCAVCENRDKKLNKNLVQAASKFERYVEWMVKSIPNIAKALQDMSYHCKDWSQEKIKKAETAGPFKYGFVFKGKDWDNSINGKLQTPIKNLTSSLQCLEVVLQTFSLKDCLQFFAKLHTCRDLKSGVIDAFKDRVQQSCGQIYSVMFVHNNSSNEYLHDIFQSADWILRNIMGSRDYGHYKDFEYDSTEYCNKTFTDGVIAKLPQFYTALYFFYFNTSTECTSIRGGLWSRNQVKDAAHKLNQWITDRIGKGPDQFMERGFQDDELSNSSTVGSTLGHQMGYILSSISLGGLQKILFTFLFLNSWDCSFSGHATLYLWMFCKEVNGSTFRSQMNRYEGDASTLKQASTELKSSLEAFVGSNAILSAVCQENDTFLYTDLFSHWHGDAFPYHMEWLKTKNLIENLKESLNAMSLSSSDWTKEKIQNANSAGPFMYGFVFANDKWGSSDMQEKLKPAISKLVNNSDGNLDKLKKALGELKERSKSMPQEEDDEKQSEQDSGAITGGEGSGDSNTTDGIQQQPLGPGSAISTTPTQSTSPSADSPRTVLSPVIAHISEGPCKFTAPASLKACLQLLAKLSNQTALRSQIVGSVQTEMKQYCASTYISQFGNDSSGHLYKAFDNSERLLRAIIGGNDNNYYGDYFSLSAACIQEYSEPILNAIKENFSKVIAALCFLYYQVSNECSTIGGGKWNSFGIRETENTKKALQTWLIESGAELMPRGFLYNELSNSSSGSGIADALHPSEGGQIAALSIKDPGTFQKVLVVLLFLGQWHESMAGHACLFVKEFCDQVKGGSVRGIFQETYPSGDFSALKEVCSTLSTDLGAFVKENDSGILRAVCQNNGKLFEGIWHYENFDEYVFWLQTHLDNIIKALQGMNEDSKSWTTTALSNASTYGPFKYGFVFSDGWEDKISTALSSQISAVAGSKSIAQLDVSHDSEFGSLSELLKVLRGLTATSAEEVSSTGLIATVGVLTTGAVGAGAAYAFNLGGFATMVHGLLGPLI